MPGGVMQLVAYGAADLFLTGNPQITFFKMVYKRYTNFSSEYIIVDFDTIPSLTTTQFTESTAIVKRNADLVSDSYLGFKLPKITNIADRPKESDPLPNGYFKWTTNVGVNLIERSEIFIGGQLIDRHYGSFINIYSTLVQSNFKLVAWRQLVGNEVQSEVGSNIIPETQLYIPLIFWFCLNPGLSLPLISIQYMEVEIRFRFRELNDLFTLHDAATGLDLSPEEFFQTATIPVEFNGFTSSNILNYFTQQQPLQDPFLMMNYIYLDESERTIFAKNTHEYLIPQVQYQLFDGVRSGPNVADLILNLPVKEFLWIIQNDDKVLNQNAWNDYLKVMKNGTFLFNGNERTNIKDGVFWDVLQNWKYHENYIPAVYNYSFSLFPEDTKPSGTSNFSRIVNPQFQLTLDDTLNPDENYILYFYAVNYNVLRVMAGMTGLVFSGV